MRPLIQARNSRFTVLTYGNFGHCANPRSAEVMGHSMVFHIYTYIIHQLELIMDHASVFTVQTEPSVGAKKAGLFPVW